MYSNISIPTFIINLKERTDRLDFILKQFENKLEFDTRVVVACKHETGSVGLWNSILKIVQLAQDSDDDVIIIVEDDHTFTEHYDRDRLMQNIVKAAEQSVELLSGGIGGFGNAVPISTNRYWVDWFWSTQFIVLYRPVFKKILDFDFKDTDTADGVLSEITSHKMVLYPFISVQKDFGYSDITRLNDLNRGKVDELFANASNKMSIYYRACLHYLQNE